MLLEPLLSTIETIKGRIDTHGATLRENEIRTRMALIDPMLQALDWDTSDPTMVAPEYSAGNGRADYALLGDAMNPVAFIEAKHFGEPLVRPQHEDQLFTYALRQQVKFAALTDGNRWILDDVSVFTGGERRLLQVSIADSPAHESALKLLLLWRRNLQSGQPIAANATLLAELVAPLPRPRPPDPSPVAQPASYDWVPLTDVEVRMQDKNPVAIRFLGDEQRVVRNRREVLIQSTEWLVQTGRLTSANLPNGPGWNFINTSPHTSSGRDFRSSREISGGIFLDVNWKRETLIKLSVKLHNHFGVNPETVELRFE